ncbi:MAG TPA: Gfo/Idh/MocA family oxidoreductase [Bryobacteraceae bacterium]|nr:Gfo/Idh/MocA family oxidoreductase [Bryobacteraceae bacterium]
MTSNAETESTRRQFLIRDAGAAALATSLATGRALGANDRVNIAFIGNGMQFEGLVRGFKARREQKKDIHIAACCDVWEPRLKFGMEQSGAEKAYKDYREVLARKDIDGVVLAVPDHWHYQMASDAMAAGKDVYLEKPMTRTVEEAAKLNAQSQKSGRLIQLGGSGPATKLYWKVNDYLKAGKAGKILWGLISYNRNTRTGMWDYPIPGVGDTPWPEAKFNPDTIDWKMWLGSAPKRKLSAERYFRWRKFWDYSTGNAGDLLYHRLGMMSTMIGFDFPTRAVGIGGTYVQKNREVPDTYMTMIEYPGDYAINMVSCMANESSVPETVYANWATIQIVNTPPAPGAPRRPRSVAVVKAERQFQKEFREANDGKTEVTIEPEVSASLGDNWVDCMRSREAPVYNALRGYQVMVAIALGVESYRKGKVMAFDPARQVMRSSAPPHKEYAPPEGA